MATVTSIKGAALAVSAQPTYRFLEPKPYKRTCQLGIVGRNMTVWNLVSSVILERHTPEEVAVDYDLPLEAVHEALDYYHRHRAAIDEEIDEIGREFGLK
jgi:uncharacterized protein (DUF433 family)